MLASVDPIDHQIGARIRAFREQCGLAQSELAEAVGAAPSDLEQYETGAASAPVSLLVRLALTLQITTSELIGDNQASWTEAVDDLARAGPDGTVELVTAFSSIPDDRVRRAFLDLAWTIVDAQAEADSEA